MINENAGWSLKYIVNLHDTMEPFPKPRGIGSCVWFVVLGEREEDSFMVMELRNKVVQYKIVLKTVRELCESKWKSTRFQFIASFAERVESITNCSVMHGAHLVHKYGYAVKGNTVNSEEQGPEFLVLIGRKHEGRHTIEKRRGYGGFPKYQLVE
ncbi:hypothetical protein Tco_0771347 [Tanacetum coccineum]|uniref:Uncharacterized protein n=1 Tax=Tanacetum coccineum TaxID=301880 RepID=A0ABQ4ZHE1_9ASTR